MLVELSIENFAIIGRLVVRFDAGFTVITGETGAGKSIIVDALQAALGGRVSSDVVRSGARLAAVEAVFEVGDLGAEPEFRAQLEDLGASVDEALILRREVSATGRGSARVNGRAMPVSVLAALGQFLVDIHGQSEHLSVLRRDRQLELVDRYGRLMPQRRDVSTAIAEYSRAKRDLESLEGGRRESEQRVDLLRFQVGEIEAARLTSGEEEALVGERNLLVNAERLALLAAGVREALDGERSGAGNTLSVAVQALRELAGIDPATSQIGERLESVSIEVQDIAQDLRRYLENVEQDPSRLAFVDERLDLIHRLQRRYGSTIDEVLNFATRANAELQDIESFDDRLVGARRHAVDAEDKAGALAESLSKNRREAAEKLTSCMHDALRGLGLLRTDFRAEIGRAEDENGLRLPGQDRHFRASPTGVDAASFLVSFNPGEEMRPIERVASGGETSRFLLALKSVLADADSIPTLIFDEADVGVGGRHGAVVGERLRGLARNRQVLSITHLAQVAALGDHHLTVQKSVVGGRSTAVVTEVEAQDRVREIAEMISGTETETALSNARELLERAAPA
jgi:DNA repair protein RecN (Recombination protein N)